MENNIQSMIDEAIEDAINQLNRLEKGSSGVQPDGDKHRETQRAKA